LSCKLGFISGPKKAVPAIDTVPTETANLCWTVMGGLLVFNAHQAYETTTHNNRSRGAGVGLRKELIPARLTP